MKQYFIIILLFFCVIGCASCGENTTVYDDAQIMKPMELMQTGNPFVLLIISLFMVFICRRK